MRSIMICNSEPTWSESAVASNPKYADIAPDDDDGAADAVVDDDVVCCR